MARLRFLDRLRKQPKTAALEQPRGRSGRSHFNGYLEYDETNAELVGRSGLAVFDRMWRTDHDVKRSLSMLANPIVGATWSAELPKLPANAEDEHSEQEQQAADDLSWALGLGEYAGEAIDTISWAEHLAEAVPLTMRSGFLPVEITWGRRDRDGRQLLVPVKLGVRLPRSIYRWHTDDCGHLEAIEQFVPQDPLGMRVGDESGYVRLDAIDLLYYRVGAEGDNWEGTSLLRAAYKAWLFKDAAERMDAMAIEREAIGLPVVYPPRSASVDPAVLDDLEQKLAMLREGELGYLLMPGPSAEDVDDGTGWRFSIEGLGGSASGGARDAQPTLQYHRDAIAAALFVEFMRLGQGGEGSKGALSTAESQDDPFLVAVESFAGIFEAEARRKLVARFYALNYPKGLRPARLTMQAADADLTALRDYASTLATAGLIHADDPLEDFLREAADLPPADPEQRKQRQEQEEEARQAELAAGGPAAAAGEDRDELHEEVTVKRGADGSKTETRKKSKVAAKAKALDDAVHGMDDMHGTKDPGALQMPGADRGCDCGDRDCDCDGGRSGCGCDHAAKTLDVPGWAEHVDTEGLTAAFDDAGPALAQAAATVVARLAADVARDGVVRDELVDELADIAGHELTRLRDTGRRSVLAERARVTLADVPAADTVVLDGERPHITARAAHFAKVVVTAIANAVSGRRLGGTSDPAILQQAGELAGASVAKSEGAAQGAGAIGDGRLAAADAMGDEIRGCRYTSILDKSRCTEPSAPGLSSCAQADDGVLRTLDDPVRVARKPPNPGCRSVLSGKNRCRCIEVYEFADESPAALDELVALFDPTQPRDRLGRWTDGLMGRLAALLPGGRGADAREPDWQSIPDVDVGETPLPDPDASADLARAGLEPNTSGLTAGDLPDGALIGTPDGHVVVKDSWNTSTPGYVGARHIGGGRAKSIPAAAVPRDIATPDSPAGRAAVQAGRRVSTGMVVVEPDHRVWVYEPKGHFGGYEHTFPKGGLEDDLTGQQNAHKELWEETGLRARVVGLVGDFEGDTGVSRYYLAVRTGGTPHPDDPTPYVKGGSETAAVKLVSPLDALTSKLNRRRDQEVLVAAFERIAAMPRTLDDGTVVLFDPDQPRDPKTGQWIETPHPSVLTVTSHLGGSTGAKLAQGAGGGKYVVKQGANPKHLLEEDAADRIYRALGVAVPDSQVHDVDSGAPTKVARFVDDATPLGSLTGMKRSLAIEQLRKGFAADALLANWDVAGLNEDNVLVTNTTSLTPSVHRIDNGGSLRFRAMGSVKQLSGVPFELWTMRESGQAKGWGLTWGEVMEQAEQLLAKRDQALDAAPGHGQREALRRRFVGLEQIVAMHKAGIPEDQIRLMVGNFDQAPPVKRLEAAAEALALADGSEWDLDQVVALAAWNPVDHPRDSKGRFKAKIGGKAMELLEDAASASPKTRAGQKALKFKETKAGAKGSSHTIALEPEAIDDLIDVVEQLHADKAHITAGAAAKNAGSFEFGLKSALVELYKAKAAAKHHDGGGQVDVDAIAGANPKGSLGQLKSALKAAVDTDGDAPAPEPKIEAPSATDTTQSHKAIAQSDLTTNEAGHTFASLAPGTPFGFVGGGDHIYVKTGDSTFEITTKPGVSLPVADPSALTPDYVGQPAAPAADVTPEVTPEDVASIPELDAIDLPGYGTIKPGDKIKSTTGKEYLVVGTDDQGNVQLQVANKPNGDLYPYTTKKLGKLLSKGSWKPVDVAPSPTPAPAAPEGIDVPGVGKVVVGTKFTDTLGNVRTVESIEADGTIMVHHSKTGTASMYTVGELAAALSPSGGWQPGVAAGADEHDDEVAPDLDDELAGDTEVDIAGYGVVKVGDTFDTPSTDSSWEVVSIDHATGNVGLKLIGKDMPVGMPSLPMPFGAFGEGIGKGEWVPTAGSGASSAPAGLPSKDDIVDKLGDWSGNQPLNIAGFKLTWDSTNITHHGTATAPDGDAMPFDTDSYDAVAEWMHHKAASAPAAAPAPVGGVALAHGQGEVGQQVKITAPPNWASGNFADDLVGQVATISKVDATDKEAGWEVKLANGTLQWVNGVETVDGPSPTPAAVASSKPIKGPQPTPKVPKTGFGGYVDGKYVSGSEATEVDPKVKDLELAPGDVVQKMKGGQKLTLVGPWNENADYWQAKTTTGKTKLVGPTTTVALVTKADGSPVALKDGTTAAPAGPKPKTHAELVAEAKAGLHPNGSAKSISDLPAGTVVATPAGTVVVKGGSHTASNGYVAVTSIDTGEKAPSIPEAAIPAQIALPDSDAGKAAAEAIVQKKTAANAAAQGVSPGTAAAAAAQPAGKPPAWAGIPDGNAKVRPLMQQWQKGVAGLLTTAERQAVTSYTGSGYGALNTMLRDDGTKLSGKAELVKKAALIKSAIDKAPAFEQDVIIGRKTQNPEWVGAAPGDVIRDRGFMSTSTDPGTWSGNVQLRIHAKKGTKGIWVGPGSSTGGGSISSHSGEDEIILPPGMHFEVLKRENKGGTTVLYVELIG